MENKWDTAIFGFVPDEFKSWYETNSGTQYTSRGWSIHSSKDANNFQNQMMHCRDLIIKEMGKLGAYVIGNKNIFELMQNKKTTIKYEYQGQDYKKEIEMP